MPTYTTLDELVDAAVHGEVWRSEFAASGIAAGGAYHLGLTLGNVPIRVLSRSYSSTDTPLTVELFEATFTGGAQVRMLNRNLAVTDSPPVLFMGGVTPGTLGSVITSVTLRAPSAVGNTVLTIGADDGVLINKRNTSYVVRFTNGGGNGVTISGAIDYRLIK